MPSGDFSREFAEAQRMMTELQSRNFGKHLKEAEADKREAQLCKRVPKSLRATHSNGCEVHCAKSMSGPQSQVARLVISAYTTFFIKKILF